MKFEVHYWPALASTWMILTMIVTYIVAVLTETVGPLFPYISDTGAKPPGSCVFGQMLNIGAAFTAITLYLRYRQVDFAVNSGDTDLPKIWNNIAFWFGNIVALGMSVVANFQANPEYPAFVMTMHVIGALMAFGTGALYLTIQTRISFSLLSMYEEYPQFAVGRTIFYCRGFLTILFYVFFFVTFIGSSISLSRFTGDDHTWWTSEYDGYPLHLVTTFSEWFMVFVFSAYMLSVTKELKSLEYHEISLKSKCVYVSNLTPESL